MKYYEAYEERYKTIHKKGHSWSSDKPTPIVLETINKLNIDKDRVVNLSIINNKGIDELKESLEDTPIHLLIKDILDKFGYEEELRKSICKWQRYGCEKQYA